MYSVNRAEKNYFCKKFKENTIRPNRTIEDSHQTAGHDSIQKSCMLGCLEFLILKYFSSRPLN